jgi:pimeloyl-ACP methyl ester carboxylesterase
VRFAKSLAASGAAVLVPEIPEWRRLEVTPRPALPTIRGSIDVLRGHAEVRPGKYGLIGFSFGAPQVAIAAGDDSLTEHVAGIVLFGGYCSLERTLMCQLTGNHEWDGVPYALAPDPYGRWVVGSNYLTEVPGHEDAGDVASALHRLASAASERRVSAWEPYHDEMIRELRLGLPARKRALFDVFATTSEEERPDTERCLAVARKLTEACRRVEPLLEPAPHLANVGVPTRLIHGRGDRLIPFTECMRLHEGLPESARQGRTVTGLFDHSSDRSDGSMFNRIRETAMFFGALQGVINTA